MNKLTIKPDGGLIQGGEIILDIQKSGRVVVVVNVVAHYLFSDHQLKQSGSYQVDPKLVLSKNVTVGEKVKIGDLALEVQSKFKASQTATATALMLVKGQLALGTATIDLSNEVISLEFLTVEAELFGQKLKIEAVP